MNKINIVGVGIMGRQIASLFVLCGWDVKILYHNNTYEEEINKGLRIIKRKLGIEKDQGTLSFTQKVEELYETATVETILEDLEKKKQIHHAVKRQFPDQLYFSNTSSYSPEDIGSDVNGLHFYNPIYLGLVEMYFVSEEAKEKSKEITETLEVLKISSVLVNPNRGYIGNYILFSEISSALKLIEKHNYTVDQVNLVYSKLYSGRNIFSIIDLIGIDVVNKIIVNLNEEDHTIYLPKCLSEALKRDILGRKNSTSIKMILNES